jgi:hypothetical protein
MTAITRVSVREGYDGPFRPLATFRFDGTQVTVDWHDDGYRKDVEANGLGAMVGGVFTILRPSDGAAFFNALPQVYSRSTLMKVETS